MSNNDSNGVALPPSFHNGKTTVEDVPELPLTRAEYKATLASKPTGTPEAPPVVVRRVTLSDEHTEAPASVTEGVEPEFDSLIAQGIEDAEIEAENFKVVNSKERKFTTLIIFGIFGIVALSMTMTISYGLSQLP